MYNIHKDKRWSCVCEMCAELHVFMAQPTCLFSGTCLNTEVKG